MSWWMLGAAVTVFVVGVAVGFWVSREGWRERWLVRDLDPSEEFDAEWGPQTVTHVLQDGTEVHFRWEGTL